MGQALDVDAGLLAWLFLTHGNAQAYANRTEEAAWSYREAARLATSRQLFGSAPRWATCPTR